MEKISNLVGMTPEGIVCHYFQEYREGDEEVDEILWVETSWPFWDLEILNEEVFNYYNKINEK